ncbi:hypothetical protein UlMin_014379 [Ulmus minor]
MDLQESLVKNLMIIAKRELFSDQFNSLSFAPPSAYDTAWLAMIPNPQNPSNPLFKGCLDWVLCNQKNGGFWGEIGHDQFVPTIQCLTATLACVVALKTWNVGDAAINKGLAFLHASAKKLLLEQNGCFPHWFAIVFPAMIELAQTKGLEVKFSIDSKALVEQVFLERHQILFQRDALCGDSDLGPYLEALPKEYNEKEILMHEKSEDESIFQSPSATAYAFMVTGNQKFLAYLVSLVKKCGHGVPQIYPLDEDLIKISLVDWIERLGLAEHFKEDIETVLAQLVRSYASEEPEKMRKHVMPLQLYKDSMAFRLLRLHGYQVSAEKFCWFLKHDDIVKRIQQHPEDYFVAMYGVHKATDVMFVGESQLEDMTRAVSKRILEKGTTQNLEKSIKDEICNPWLAQLDHLEHRKFIERNIESINQGISSKAPFYRLSSLRSPTLLQLAVENFSLRQSMFRDELKELERWSKGFGLCDMGFAREKTAYCYFAVAATVPLPTLSDVRFAVVKSAILVTVADDFFDAEASLEELETFTRAIERWDKKDLHGHSKFIFKALESLVDEISLKVFTRNGYDIKKHIQDLWYQTFLVWLEEAKWSKNGHVPSTTEYLEVATSSIATQTIVLPASFLICPNLPLDMLKFPQREKCTQLLMVLTRLLNDIRTYQREKDEGKSNLVLLYMKENPEMGTEDSIAVIQKILDEKNKEFLEHVLVKGKSDLPEACKQLHLSCLKAFQRFYSCTNAFDSPTELLADIKKAIYDPLVVEDQLNSFETFGLNKNKSSRKNEQIGKHLQFKAGISSQLCSRTSAKSFQRKVIVPQLKIRYSNLSISCPKPNLYTRYPCIL